MQHARPNRLGRVAVYAALAMLLGVVSLTLSQCTLVGDNITGVDLNRNGPTTCIKMCNDDYKVFFDDEIKLHLANNVTCLALPQPDKDACLAAEKARHDAEMDRLGQAKIDCQDNCHHQGTGSAG